VCELELGNAEVPGSAVPDNRGHKQREHHRVSRAASYLENQLDGKQRDDAESDGGRSM